MKTADALEGRIDRKMRMEGPLRPGGPALPLTDPRVAAGVQVGGPCGPWAVRLFAHECVPVHVPPVPSPRES